ncbi:MAG TPA: ABC transporter substrate-binding protein [Vicinamibacterales bacterium]|nr:ABC transporter substrate-binding protein [Vicinamibacterales bacterium]
MLLFVLSFLQASPQDPSPKSQDRRPVRIISLIPAVTEMLFAIGAGPQVVGVSSYDTYPPEATTLPKVGALVDPDFERILTLKPDLVVVYGTQADLITRLGRVNIPMFKYQHAGLADITTTIRTLGARVGRTNDASNLAATIERGLEATRRRVAGRPRPKTALLFGREPGSLRSLFASGGYGFMHDMLETAGGADIFADMKKQSVQTSAEMLLARSPEVIIEVHPAGEWTPARIAAERKVWNGLPSLPAVKSDRIYILADDRLNTPGPRVADAVRMLADILHPIARSPDALPSLHRPIAHRR